LLAAAIGTAALLLARRASTSSLHLASASKTSSSEPPSEVLAVSAPADREPF
jgi:hypothetical protein